MFVDIDLFDESIPSQSNFKLCAVLEKRPVNMLQFFASNSLSCQNVMKQVIILLKTTLYR